VASTPKPARRRLPSWLIAVVAGTAAVIVLASPAAAPPHPGSGSTVDAVSPIGTPSQQLAVTTLSLQQLVPTATLTVGSTATIELTVTNTGSALASGVTLRDDLPAGLTLVSSQPVGILDSTGISWNLGTLPMGSQQVVSITVRVADAGSFTNRASVRSDATDEVSSTALLTAVASGLAPPVSNAPGQTSGTTPPPVSSDQLAATGATLNWLLAGALAAVAAGALAVEAASRLPAMASLRAPRRRRSRPVFHPVRSSSHR
jgi:uncharacterized repeat protein (TIGR01451 family)